MKPLHQRLAVVLAGAIAAGTTVLSTPALADHDSCGTGHDMGAATTGTVTSANRYDWWQSTSVVPLRQFTLQPAVGDADLAVFSADCSTLLCSSSLSSTATDTCTVTQVGAVNVRVYYYSSPTGSVPYSLSTTPAPVNAGPSPTPGVYPSDDCVTGGLGQDLVSGFAGDTYVTLRTTRSGNQTWVCARVDSGSTTYGGKLVVSDLGVPSVTLPRVDNAGGACAATPGNRNLATVPNQVYLDTVTTNGETWVCLRAPLVSSRVVVTFDAVGPNQQIAFYPDAPGRHVREFGAPAAGSGDCQRAPYGTDRHVDLATSGTRAYLYTNVVGSTAKVCLGQQNPTFLGGVLEVSVSGGGIPNVSLTGVQSCPDLVAKVDTVEVRTGRTATSAAACVVTPAGTYGVLVSGGSGAPVSVSWTPDQGSVLD